MPLKILFMGTPEFSVPILKSIHDSKHKVLGVYTQPPKKKDRGQKIQISAIHKLSNKLGIPVRHPISFDENELDHIKKGSTITSLGEIVCYNFYSKKKAVEHAYHYKNNPRYIGDQFKKIILVKMAPIIDRLSSELAGRYVLRECFNFKNIYGGSPFIMGHSKAKDWLK